MADKASLSSVRRSIREDLSRAGIAQPVVFDCLIAVTEAWNQIIEGVEVDDIRPEIGWELEPSAIRFFVQGTCTRASSKASHPSGGISRPSAFSLVDAELGGSVMAATMDEVQVQAGPLGRTISLTKHLT